MSKVNKVGHVVLAVKDPEASAKWYVDILGMEMMNYSEKGNPSGPIIMTLPWFKPPRVRRWAAPGSATPQCRLRAGWMN